MICRRAGNGLSELDIFISSVRVKVSTALERYFEALFDFFPSTHRSCLCIVKESIASRLDERKGFGTDINLCRLLLSYKLIASLEF